MRRSPWTEVDTDSSLCSSPVAKPMNGERIKVCLDLRYLQRACENSPLGGGLGGVGTYSANLWNMLARRRSALLLRPMLTPRSPVAEFRDLVEGLDETSTIRAPLVGHRLVPPRLSFGRFFPLLQALESEFLLARTLAKHDLDVIHMPDQNMPPAGKFAKIVTVHDVPFKVGQPQTKFKQFYLRRIVQRADRVVCVSSSTARELVAFAPEARDKITVCPSGLDLKSFRPGLRDPEGVAERFQLTKPYFLHVGVCTGRKNPDGILEAIAKVRMLYGEPFEMVFVGPYQVNQSALEYLVSRGRQLGIHDQLRFPGNVSINELVMLYRNSAALVFPSLMEGFGYPPVEALACGVPCIVSDEGAVAEIVGDAGMQVEVKSSEQIAAAMITVLRRQHKDVTISGPALAARYSSSSVADCLTKIYESLATGASDLMT
ncbi:MAG: glycosyltransferase family 4 protein [Candidatus Binataceae bacterium]